MEQTREATRQRRKGRTPPYREDGHGRRARRPEQIPDKGWRDIIMRVKNQIGEDNLSIVAAGVAFFAFLAIFPAIAALVSIYGLVVDPQIVQQQLQQVAGFFPAQSRQLISQMLQQIAAGSQQGLGWGLAISLLLALWGANKGTKALFTGINIVYNEHDDRGFIKQNALTLLFSLGGILLAVVSLALVVALPAILGILGLPLWGHIAARIFRWLLLTVVVLGGLSLLYRYAPDRNKPRWQWITWGSGIATVLWLVASWAFSFYVSNWGSYNKTYGSLAAVVILLLWFMLTSFTFLLGAEINSEMEAQTQEDTTVGPDKPIGERNALKADTVSESP
ncbi:MAG: YihY family inner membrane protein [Chitinivibrionales bacterium]|nr:YihY family inner membrane protein [Chitinivibrionales bacterium]